MAPVFDREQLERYSWLRSTGPDPQTYEAWQAAIRGSSLRESIERAGGVHATELRQRVAASYRATIRHRVPRGIGGDVISVDDVRSLIVGAVKLSHRTLTYSVIVAPQTDDV